MQLENKVKSILEIVDILQCYIKKIACFCRTSSLKKITSDFNRGNFEINDSFIKNFCKILDENKCILSDRTTCPLFIVIAGLWSSFYRRELQYIRIYGANNLKFLTCVVLKCFLEECIKEMLVRGVDPNIIHNHIHGSTAMHWIVAWDRSYAGIDLLKLTSNFQGNFNPNVLDSCNRSVLSLLVARKYFGRTRDAEIYDNQLIKCLTDFDTDIASQDNLGNTALHYACLKRDIFAVDALISVNNNANLWSIKNHINQSARDMCDISYENASLILKKVYIASTAEHMMNSNRWHNNKEAFVNHIDKLISIKNC